MTEVQVVLDHLGLSSGEGFCAKMSKANFQKWQDFRKSKKQRESRWSDVNTPPIVTNRHFYKNGKIQPNTKYTANLPGFWPDDDKLQVQRPKLPHRILRKCILSWYTVSCWSCIVRLLVKAVFYWHQVPTI